MAACACFVLRFVISFELLKPFTKLEAIHFVKWEACTCESPHTKPTILLNALWFRDVSCDKFTQSHAFVSLAKPFTDSRPGRRNLKSV